MLDKVKLALRLSGTALDGEVSDLINAAIADLRLVGINIPAEAGSSSKTLGDPLLDRAVVLYAKAEFGFNDDAERYRNAYDYLKCALSLTADYTEESESKSMRWGEQITLVALSEPSPRTNEHGFPVARTETATTVFADKKSVGFSEFYKAQQAGYTTELKFDVHSFEYEEQQIVEYPVSSGKRYRVLRTYTHGNGEFTELTLVNLPEAEGGGNNGEV